MGNYNANKKMAVKKCYQILSVGEAATMERACVGGKSDDVADGLLFGWYGCVHYNELVDSARVRSVEEISFNKQKKKALRALDKQERDQQKADEKAAKTALRAQQKADKEATDALERESKGLPPKKKAVRRKRSASPPTQAPSTNSKTAPSLASKKKNKKTGNKSAYRPASFGGRGGSEFV